MLVVWIKMVPVVGEKELGLLIFQKVESLSVTDDCMWRIRKREEFRMTLSYPWFESGQLGESSWHLVRRLKNEELVAGVTKRWRIRLYTSWVWDNQLKNEQRKVSRVETSSSGAVRSKDDEDTPAKKLTRNHQGDWMRWLASFAYLYLLLNNYILLL